MKGKITDLQTNGHKITGFVCKISDCSITFELLMTDLIQELTDET